MVQEVGRDPLRVPIDTPPDQVIEVARKLSAARQLLETVLPQAEKPFMRQAQVETTYILEGDIQEPK